MEPGLGKAAEDQQGKGKGAWGGGRGTLEYVSAGRGGADPQEAGGKQKESDQDDGRRHGEVDPRSLPTERASKKWL